MHPIFSLNGQAALITGAGSAPGIGFASARLLAEMGTEVAVKATGKWIQQRVSEHVEVGHFH
jgi:3-oxoacyl-[acyl-carrier protein] reductase